MRGGVSVLAGSLIRVCVGFVSFFPKCLLELTTGTIWSSLCFYFKFHLSIREDTLFKKFILVSAVMICVFLRICPSVLSVRAVGIVDHDVSYHFPSVASLAMSTLLSWYWWFLFFLFSLISIEAHQSYWLFQRISFRLYSFSLLCFHFPFPKFNPLFCYFLPCPWLRFVLFFFSQLLNSHWLYTFLLLWYKHS